MTLGVLFRVIGSNLGENSFLADLAKNRVLTPWDFGQNCTFGKTFCIGKKVREMMFGVVFRMN